MTEPLIEVEGCRRAHITLHAAIAGLTDDQVGEPSLLPDWTVGHVLTHIARNADGMSRRISAMLRNEMVDQYVGGVDGRAREIEAAASRSAEAIVADVSSSAELLDSLFTRMPPGDWEKSVRTVSGGKQAVSTLPFRRWREVEIHLVDVGLG